MKKKLLCILLGTVLLTTITSVAGTVASTKSSWNELVMLDPLKTLYVGGNGPGNYTRIQDAIDNASDGDTVFVYDDSSPYIENIQIEKKSITLMGEDKDTTIIRGNDSFWDWTVHFNSATQATIQGFTIQHSETDAAHIGIIFQGNCSHIFISDMILTQKCTGYTEGIRVQFSYQISISNTTIRNKDQGIIVIGSHDVIISRNKITDNGDDNSPYGERQAGLSLTSSYCTCIENNDIRGNSIGVILWASFLNMITTNNIVNNSKMDVFLDGATGTTWSQNYWGELLLPIKIIVAGRFIDMLGRWIPTRINVDWHPAREPYKVP